jgi:tetratricopeptide (TPR) repeat protein
MITIRKAPWLLSALLTCMFSGEIAARAVQSHDQSGHPPTSQFPRELIERPIVIRPDIGQATDPVTTSSPAAQNFYNQGVADLHSFMWIDAARSFYQALRFDPRLAMAYLGLSYAFSGLNAASEPYSMLKRAIDLAGAVSPREQRRITLRAKELEAEADPGNAAKRAAYIQQLDAVLDLEPGDLEVWLLRGHAANTEHPERFYNRVLDIAPNYFAAHHYLTHAFENSGRIDEALLHAEAYARLAPAVPHAHHMYGHELRRVGRVEDAIAQFLTAHELEIHRYAEDQIPAAYDWHHHHNMELLAVSYEYEGQVERAGELLQNAFSTPVLEVVEELNNREWPVFLLARGRPQEALAAGRVLAASPAEIVRATGHIVSGRALLSIGDFQGAAVQANAAVKELRSVGEMAKLIAPHLEALQGEFFLRTGQRDRGRSMLREAIRKIRAEPGPDAWSFALFSLESIAHAARSAGDWEFAGYAAEQMRDHDPAYGGTHYALGLVAEHFGRREDARTEYSLAVQDWKRADNGFAELTDVKSRLAALQ